MAIRMFDNARIDDPWFTRLSLEYQYADWYLNSRCNYGGVLDIDIDELNYKTKKNDISFELLKRQFKDKFVILNETQNEGNITRLKVFMPEFIFIQYKNRLTPSNPVHRHVHRIFKQEGIAIEPYLAPRVLKEDFENWEDICIDIKKTGISYKELLKERKNN